MKVKNVYPQCYKNEEERRKAVKQTYQKIIIKLVLENDKGEAEKRTS